MSGFVPGLELCRRFYEEVVAPAVGAPHGAVLGDTVADHLSRREQGAVRHRPRRASCTGCAKTHVLLSTAWLLRRADAVSVIGSALLAKVAGAGHRPIAAVLGRPASTVRGWLRRFAARAEQLRVLFTRLLHCLDPQAGPLVPRESVFADALEALGRAGAAGVRRLEPRPPWEFASWASAGLLLAPTVGW